MEFLSLVGVANKLELDLELSLRGYLTDTRLEKNFPVSIWTVRCEKNLVQKYFPHEYLDFIRITEIGLNMSWVQNYES